MSMFVDLVRLGPSRSASYLRPSILLAILLLGLPSAVGRQQRSPVEERFLQAISPSPIDPTLEVAIPAGRVLLYGQVVDPPFEVSIQGNALFLNGVQIVAVHGSSVVRSREVG